MEEEYTCEAERLLLENGYEGVIYLKDYSYDTALVGVSKDHCTVYNYDLMMEWLIKEDGFEKEFDAMDWIDLNTIRAIDYFGPGAPIVYYPKDYEGQSAFEYLVDHCYEDEIKPLDGLEECFMGLDNKASPVYDLKRAEKLIPGVSQRDYPI